MESVQINTQNYIIVNFIAQNLIIKNKWHPKFISPKILNLLKKFTHLNINNIQNALMHGHGQIYIEVRPIIFFFT